MAKIPASFDSIKYYLENYAPDLRADKTDKTSIVSTESSVTLKGYYIKAINFNLKYIVLSEFNEELQHDSVTDINDSNYVESRDFIDGNFPQSGEFNIQLVGGSYFNLTLSRLDEISNAYSWTDSFPYSRWSGDDSSIEKAKDELLAKIAQGRPMETANYIWTIDANKNAIERWGTMYGVTLPKKLTFAFGHKSQALQNGAFAAGEHALAQGANAAAFGRATVANKGSFAAGYGNIAEGDYSIAIGGQNIASGQASMAEGNHTRATGDFSHTEGRSSVTYGHSAHAEGWGTVAGSGEALVSMNSDQNVGQFTHAEGNGTIASGNSSHAEGRGSKAAGIAAHAEGWSTVAEGARSHTEGSGSKTSAFAAHAEGHQTVASGLASHAEGSRFVDTADNNKEYYTTASGEGAHAEGCATMASGAASHSEGYRTVASGSYAHAEGVNNTVSAYAGHAEGSNNTVTGTRAHAEGRGTTAEGEYAHAEGNSTKAIGARSHAEGSQTEARGFASHASGKGTIATAEGQMVTGKYNSVNDNALFIVGKGTGPEDAKRSNAFEVTNNTVIAHHRDLLAGLIQCVGSVTYQLGYSSSEQAYQFGNYNWITDKNSAIASEDYELWLADADFVMIQCGSYVEDRPATDRDLYMPITVIKAMSHFEFDYNAYVSNEEKLQSCFIAFASSGSSGVHQLFIGNEFWDMIYTDQGNKYSHVTITGYKLPTL